MIRVNDQSRWSAGKSRRCIVVSCLCQERYSWRVVGIHCKELPGGGNHEEYDFGFLRVRGMGREVCCCSNMHGIEYRAGSSLCNDKSCGKNIGTVAL
jgi:hypothetical protein